MNKKWGDNKSGMEDYFDFDKLRSGRGLETMSMSEFLGTAARGGLLDAPLPNNDTELLRKPLWDYLNSSCFVRAWSPGKLFIGFNISSITDGNITPAGSAQSNYVGTFEQTDRARITEFALSKSIIVL